jgi:biopolymer transport protein TolR
MAGTINTGRGKRRRNAEINVVPYIDVMLVLLVIFMVTAPLLTQGIDVQLPEAANAPLPTEDQPITMTIDKSGRYYLDVGAGNDKALSDDDLTDTIAKVIRQKPDTLVLVRADNGVPYGDVVRGMTLVQAAGANKIGFVTDPKSIAKSASPKRPRG